MPSARRVELAERLQAYAAERGDHDRNMEAVEALYRSAARGRLEIPLAIRPS
jgi:hypothetical protein